MVKSKADKSKADKSKADKSKSKVVAASPEVRGESRRVLRLLAEYSGGPRLYVIALVLLVAEAVTSVFQPYPIAYLIDFFRSDRPPIHFLNLPWLSSPRAQTLAVLTGGLILLTMVNSLADSLTEMSLAKGGRTLGYNTREALYGRLHRLSLAFHGHRRTGDMLTRVTSDVGALEDFVVDSVSDLVGSVLTLIGTLAFLFYQSWQVALVALLIVPLMSLVSNHFSQRIKTASKKLRAREGDLASVAQEMLSSIRVIQTYGRSAYEERRFAEQSRRSMEASLETAVLKARFSWVVAVLEALAISAVAWIGLVLIDRRTVTVGTLVLFVILIQNMFKPTRKIIREWTTIGKIFASVERIAEVLDREALVRDKSDAILAPPFAGRLSFDHVHFAYQLEAQDAAGSTAVFDRRVALRDVSFDIQPGEVVALVGASGAGKSTIAQLIPRLYDPDEGAVRIDGVETRDFTLESLRAQVSMVLQETVLFSGTVAENIAYGREDATQADVVDAARKAHADGFIVDLPDGYDTVLGERGANLSGGQRQRIAIARAFIRDSPILILDEPTTGLDSVATEAVLMGLHALMAGKTTVIISHDLHLVAPADRVLVLEEGSIVESGTHQSLLRSGGAYAQFCARQGIATPAAEVLTPTSATPPPDVDEQRYPTPAGLDRRPPGRGHGRRLARLYRRHRFDPSRPGPVPSPRSSVVLPAPPRPDAAAVPEPNPAAVVEPAAAMASVHPTAAAALHGTIEGPAWPLDLDPAASPLLRRALPGLHRALDAEVMIHELQVGLFGAESDLRVEGATPGKAMFLGGDGVTLRYALQVRSGATGELRQELVLGRLFASDDQAQTYRESLEPLLEAMDGHPEAVGFGSLCASSASVPGLVLHAYPVDRDLPTLITATDGGRMLDVFGEAMARSGMTVHDCTVVLGHYGRRNRCVLRYGLDVSSNGSGRIGKAVVYGKVYSGETGALVASVVPQTRRYLSDHSSAAVNVPAHLSYRPDLHLSLLSQVPGEPMIARAIKSLCRGSSPAPGSLKVDEAIADAARVLAAVHGGPVPKAPGRDLGGDIGDLRHQLVEMAAISPQFAVLLHLMLDDIETAAAATHGGSARFGHGDYTLSQLLHDQRSVGLVDFDSACVAEPALDLGHFLAYLAMTIAKHQPTPEMGSALFRRLYRIFLYTYAGQAGSSASDPGLAGRIQIFQALSLLRITVHAWQKMKPERTRLVMPLLEAEIKALA